ncbi:MAG: rod shape-determining protein MreD [Algoriphagus sp. 32-45-6]|jgi:hypothetical protein|nr:MAG: rod shape-determining protein MreD [Algoriphagus sp. 32-45-6]
MNIRNLISDLLLVITLVLVQIFLLKNLAVFGVGFGFLYVLGILILPISLRTIPLMLIAFGMGLIVDVFYETVGMHTASATFLAFIRPLWLKAISPTGGYDESDEPTLNQMGLRWFVSYGFPLIFVYSLVFFVIDQLGVGNIFMALNKSLFSTIFSMLLAILVQLLFFKRRRSIR